MEAVVPKKYRKSTTVEAIEYTGKQDEYAVLDWVRKEGRDGVEVVKSPGFPGPTF